MILLGPKTVTTLACLSMVTLLFTFALLRRTARRPTSVKLVERTPLASEGDGVLYESRARAQTNQFIQALATNERGWKEGCGHFQAQTFSWSLGRLSRQRMPNSLDLKSWPPGARTSWQNIEQNFLVCLEREFSAQDLSRNHVLAGYGVLESDVPELVVWAKHESARRAATLDEDTIEWMA